ncbi:MAG: hypothetical protein LBK66_01770 [Spirochaetaceae bacterium]|jgi:hypothetical protein|nr:hypothetical protein [Spirochaetaceae bacterium]
MADLTEEEYDALDEYYTKNPPKIDPAKNGTGFFSRRKAASADPVARSITVDSFTADYLLTKAIAARKTPADIIGDMVREKINVAY